MRSPASTSVTATAVLAARGAYDEHTLCVCPHTFCHTPQLVYAAYYLSMHAYTQKYVYARILLLICGHCLDVQYAAAPAGRSGQAKY
jgi:hypothetical protein